MTILQKLFK